MLVLGAGSQANGKMGVGFYSLELKDVDGGAVADGMTLKEGSTNDASVADHKRRVRQPTG